MTKKRRNTRRKSLDNNSRQDHTETVLQLSGNYNPAEPAMATLVDLRKGDAGIVDAIDLPDDDARRLMELGFLPGARVIAGLSAPGGDPKVFQVDGSEVALRRETARRLRVRVEKSKPQ